MMPINRLTAIVPSISNVVAALRDLGFRNAGTPLLIASTPVSAAQPDENDRATRNSNAKPAIWLRSACITKPADSARSGSPSTENPNKTPPSIMGNPRKKWGGGGGEGTP